MPEKKSIPSKYIPTSKGASSKPQAAPEPLSEPSGLNTLLHSHTVFLSIFTHQPRTKDYQTQPTLTPAHTRNSSFTSPPSSLQPQ